MALRKKTLYQQFLISRNIDNFEYMKIIPDKFAWDKLQKEFKEWLKELKGGVEHGK